MTSWRVGQRVRSSCSQIRKERQTAGIAAAREANGEFRNHRCSSSLDMRYVLTIVGFLGLGLGFVWMFNAQFANEIAKGTVVAQLGGVFLAVGMAATDIVEAIKRRSVNL